MSKTGGLLATTIGETVLWQMCQRVEGSSTNRPNPLPAHAYPTKIFSIFQSLWKILKTFQIIENTRNIVDIVLILRICRVKVSKIQVEREGGVGDW
jgi:hypothetical protein